MSNSEKLLNSTLPTANSAENRSSTKATGVSPGDPGMESPETSSRAVGQNDVRSGKQSPSKLLGPPTRSSPDLRLVWRPPTANPQEARERLPENLEQDLAAGKKAWVRYQRDKGNDQGAVYRFLRVISKIARRWNKEGCAKAYARKALKVQTNRIKMKLEPYAILIFCTADPKLVDHRTRSKWSRALRFAESRNRDPGTNHANWIRQHGGLNKSARRFAKQRKRLAKQMARDRKRK